MLLVQGSVNNSVDYHRTKVCCTIQIWLYFIESKCFKGVLPKRIKTSVKIVVKCRTINNTVHLLSAKLIFLSQAFN